MAVSTAADEAAPRSSHVADPVLRPFLQPTFSPADYLNAALPPLVYASRSSKTSAVSLPELSSQTQTLLSQLNAHTARLSTILTQLTDDILRSGGRLAYEVEVLRGETLTLSEALTDGLQSDIGRFLPGGISLEKQPVEATSESSGDEDVIVEDNAGDEPRNETIDQKTHVSSTDLPPYITQLRTLTLVRNRLDDVIKVFGDAMQWSMPPSEVSLASSFISVSAPEPGSDSHSREEKGREFAERLRNEISDLITGSDSDGSKAEAAMSRIQALRDLAEVWKGTAEEKARIKFVESLIKLAEERQRTSNSSGGQKQRASRGRSPQKQPRDKGPGGGFLENLSRMRGNIYLD